MTRRSSSAEARGGRRSTCGSRPPTAAPGPDPWGRSAHDDDVVEHLLDDVGRPVDDVGALGEHGGELRARRGRSGGSRAAPACRVLAAAQMPSARAAQARSPILLTPPSRRRTAPTPRTTAKPTQIRVEHDQPHTPSRRRSGRCSVVGVGHRPASRRSLGGRSVAHGQLGERRRRRRAGRRSTSRSNRGRPVECRRRGPGCSGPARWWRPPRRRRRCEHELPALVEDEEAVLAVGRPTPPPTITPMMPAAANGVISPSANSSPAPISVPAASAGLQRRPAHPDRREPAGGAGERATAEHLVVAVIGEAEPEHEPQHQQGRDVRLLHGPRRYRWSPARLRRW